MSLSVNVSVNDLTIYDLGLYFTYKSIAKKYRTAKMCKVLLFSVNFGLILIQFCDVLPFTKLLGNCTFFVRKQRHLRRALFLASTNRAGGQWADCIRPPENSSGTRRLGCIPTRVSKDATRSRTTPAHRTGWSKI